MGDERTIERRPIHRSADACASAAYLKVVERRLGGALLPEPKSATAGDAVATAAAQDLSGSNWRTDPMATAADHIAAWEAAHLIDGETAGRLRAAEAAGVPLSIRRRSA
ncbi:MAG TPA: hypothetical protein VEO91_00865 [Candidatus Limnocylindria bacterium]|nr:hypothetical protein [Candidatus Limnocylindria bacterium]